MREAKYRRRAGLSVSLAERDRSIYMYIKRAIMYTVNLATVIVAVPLYYRKMK